VGTIVVVLEPARINVLANLAYLDKVMLSAAFTSNASVDALDGCIHINVSSDIKLPEK